MMPFVPWTRSRRSAEATQEAFVALTQRPQASDTARGTLGA